MRAPNPDGSFSGSSSLFTTGSISDMGPGRYREIFLDSLTTAYKPGDSLVITGAPTLSGEYTVLYCFLAPGGQSYVDLDGNTYTANSFVSPNAQIITTFPSTIPGGRDE